ncbi:MAG: response regulator transcription factor [Firmicutes bacterium]|nr:response regulator transcription factor [Bacillota bacterium]
MIILGKIKICVVDDHTILRQTLVKSLNDESDMEVVNSWDNAEDCIKSLDAEPGDIYILDMKLPGMSGTEAARKIKARSPEAQVIILSAFSDEKHVCGAIEAGATGYLPKEGTIEALVEAIRAVFRGEAAVEPSIMRTVLEKFRDLKKKSRADYNFSDVENQIIILLSEGYTNQEIGEQTGLTERQVRTQLTEIGKKLGAKDRTHLVAIAFKTGLLKLDD